MFEKIKEVSFVVFVFGFALAFSFSSQFVTFRVLGLHDYGIFAVIYSLSAIVSVIGTVGFDVSSLRFFSTLNDEKKASFFKFSMRKTIITAISSSLIVFVFAGFVYQIPYYTVAYAIFSCVLWSFVRVFSALLRAVGRFKLSLLIDRFCRDGLITLVAIYGIALNRSMTVSTITLVMIAGGVLGVAIALPVFRAYLNPYSDDDKREQRIWLAASIGLLLINVLELTFSRIEVILCSYLSGAETAAILNVISVISNIVTIPSAALTIMAMPIIARYYFSGDKGNLNKLLSAYTVINVIAGILISIFIIKYSSIFVGLFGKTAVDSLKNDNLNIIIYTKLFTTLFCAASPLILMSGKVKGLIWTYAGILGAKLVGLVYFVPYYGLGAGIWSMSAGMLVLVLFQCVLALRILRKDQHSAF